MLSAGLSSSGNALTTASVPTGKQANCRRAWLEHGTGPGKRQQPDHQGAVLVLGNDALILVFTLALLITARFVKPTNALGKAFLDSSLRFKVYKTNHCRERDNLPYMENSPAKNGSRDPYKITARD